MDGWITVTHRNKGAAVSRNHGVTISTPAHKTMPTSIPTKRLEQPVVKPTIYPKDHYYRKYITVFIEPLTKNMYVKYHDTIIVSILTDSRSIVLNTGGYFTLTTRLAMMEVLEPFEIKIRSDWSSIAAPWGSSEFTNNMRVVPPPTYGIVFGPVVFNHVQNTLRLKTSSVRPGNRITENERNSSPSHSHLSYTTVPSSLNHTRNHVPPQRSEKTSPTESLTHQEEVHQGTHAHQSTRSVSGQDVFPKTTAGTPPHASPCEEDIECVMCMDEERSVVLVPCFHAPLCERCTNTILKSPMAKECPTCRSEIHDVIYVRY